MGRPCRRRRVNGAVYFRAFCDSYSPAGGKSAFVGGQGSANEECKMFEWVEGEILRVSVKFLVFPFSSGYVPNLSPLLERMVMRIFIQS